jgi:hypothetical protein
MLEHVIEAQVLNLILRSMNLAVAVLEVRLNDKRRWVASLGRAGVIRARVPTLCKNIRDAAVDGDDLLDELGEAGINEIGDDADRLGLACIERLLDVAGHVLLEHGFDVAAFLFVGLEDGLAA